MSQKKVLIKGALLLTIAGILSRFIGFFYRIFLSNTIGAEGMGIYQLIFPIYSLCHSIAVAALQTAISQDVATQTALHQYKNARTTLKAGLILSLSLSLSVCFIVFRYSDFIALYILGDVRCSDLLKIMVLAIPFSSIHSCINGYYYGLQKATVPAFSQLFEQIIRVFSVYLLTSIYIENGFSIKMLDNERKEIDVVMTELAAFCAANDVGIIVVVHLNRQGSAVNAPNSFLSCIL